MGEPEIRYYHISKSTRFRKPILVSIDSEIPVSYLFVIHQNLLSRSPTKLMGKKYKKLKKFTTADSFFNCSIFVKQNTEEKKTLN